MTEPLVSLRWIHADTVQPCDSATTASKLDSQDVSGQPALVRDHERNRGRSLQIATELFRRETVRRVVGHEYGTFEPGQLVHIIKTSVADCEAPALNRYVGQGLAHGPNNTGVSVTFGATWGGSGPSRCHPLMLPGR